MIYPANGFKVAQLDLASAYHDPNLVETHYLPALENPQKEMPGADKIFFFDWRLCMQVIHEARQRCTYR